jgi:hypothetical protein
MTDADFAHAIECIDTWFDDESETVEVPYAAIAHVRAEATRLRALINTPRTDDFFEAVRIEAAHQIDRWGVDHDAGKRTEDWLTLYTYLLGKAARAHFDRNHDKLLHHIITVAAVALNWHRSTTGENTRMRPGIALLPHEVSP